VIRLAEVQALPVRTVAGLMTGTSMDGLDIGVCRIHPGDRLTFELLAFETVPIPDALKRRLMDEASNDLAALARLDLELGRFSADALAGVLGRHGLTVDLIGSHGQTVYHEHGVTTLQVGEPSPLAARFGCPVVSDFRRADLAVGGCGAPLVSYVDHRLLGGRGTAILAVNIGGIANFTALPKTNRGIDALVGMDCGPGNMVLDRLVERHTGQAWHADVDGRLAAKGTVLAHVLDELTRHPFFRQPPPKSTGREQFGEAFVVALLARVQPHDQRDWHDLLATVTELTAYGIHQSYKLHVAPTMPIDEVMVSGGGARNPEIMRRLAARFAPIPVRGSDHYGLPAEAKEAIAFAVLASDRVDGRPANVPSVTGAERPVLLGKITEV
jgi:anhydro-N-acetylmuramic acid kinase